MPSKSKSASKKAAEPVAANTVVSEPEETPASVLAESFASIIAAIAEQRTVVSSLNKQVRELEKLVRAELKRAQKKRPRAKRPSDPSRPNAFAKPRPISDALAAFLGEESGAMLSRTEVSARLHAYIKEKGLQKKEDGRLFNIDKELAKLFSHGDTKFKKGQEMSLFGYQKHWSHHILKADS